LAGQLAVYGEVVLSLLDSSSRCISLTGCLQGLQGLGLLLAGDSTLQLLLAEHVAAHVWA
jgi:hypothetical protein